MMSLPDDQPRAEEGFDDGGEAGHRRLWTPWRMCYVGGATAEPGCIFCSRLAAANDVRSLILHRGTHAFVIMNLFPYNTGHTMIVPNEHTSSPEDTSADAAAEMSALRRPLLRALRRALSCHGFNLGVNVGSEAGAGIAAHLHEHVVPRWTGDANFMPILASTTVMPELIPITYAKVRAELVRERTGSAEVHCVILSHDDGSVVLDAAGAIPTVIAGDEEAIWKSAAATLSTLVGIDLQLTGWAGDTDAGSAANGLSFRTVQPATPKLLAAPGWHWIATSEAISGPAGQTVANVLANQSPLSNRT